MKDFPVSEGPRTNVTAGPNTTRAGSTVAPMKVRWVSLICDISAQPFLVDNLSKFL